MLKKLSTTLLIAFGALLWTTPAFAYTGTYGVFPTVSGGPSSVTVTNFDLDTSSGSTTITTGLNYLYSITITTSEPIDNHFLVKEYPSGSEKAYDIIVAQKVQDAMTEAVMTIWAPDTESLVVEHDHKGAEIEYVTATKVENSPVDANGNVLWQFTVHSFSSFTPFDTLETAMSSRPRWGHSIFNSLLPLLLVSISAPLILRRRA